MTGRIINQTFAILNVAVVAESAKVINAHWGDDGVDYWIARSQLQAETLL
jgi:hypothetical protein